MKLNCSEQHIQNSCILKQNCGSLLLANTIYANLCSEIQPFQLTINFYNFASKKIIIKAKLHRRVDFIIKNQFQEVESKIKHTCISLWPKRHSSLGTDSISGTKMQTKKSILDVRKCWSINGM